MPLPSETVALPLVKGVDLSTDARLLNPPALLEATNAKFSGGGAKKRRGHTPIYMRGEGPPIGGIQTNGTPAVNAYYQVPITELTPVRWRVTARQAGVVGNTYTLVLAADGTGTGSLTDGTSATFHFEAGVTTATDLINALATSAYMIGTVVTDGAMTSGYASTYTLAHGADEIARTTLSWVYGVGYNQARGTDEEDINLWTSPIPDVGNVQGVAVRDDEMVVWDGFRMFSYLPSQEGAQNSIFAEVGNAVMPSLNATPVAKDNLRQSMPEMADNGLTRIIAWIDDTASPVVKYEVQDIASGAVMSSGTCSSTTTPKYIRAFTLENWMHIAIMDTGNARVHLYSIPSYDPNSVTFRSMGDCSGGHFDLWKMSNTEAMVVKSNGTLDFTFVQSNGAGSDTRNPFSYTVASTAATLVSAACSTVTGEYAVAWLSPSQHIGIAVLSTTGAELYSSTITSNYTSTQRLTLSPKESQTALGHDLWDLFWDETSLNYLRRIRFWRTGAAIVKGTEVHQKSMQLCSRAFRVGDRTFVWAGRSSTAQSVWLLLDEGLRPVGHMDFGLANINSVAGALVGLNWNGSSASSTSWHCAMSHKLRVVPDNTAQATGAIYTEPAIKAVYLDFLPPLRTAQAGRTLYIAGAQLWAYDGKEVVEAGFHVGPEVTLLAAGGGSLTADGTYSYRIDLCYRNAQNEEVRSLSILSSSLTLSGANKTISLSWEPVVTRRENSYFLIYRNAMSAGVPLTNWWLLNSRNPADASFVPNTQGTGTIGYSDAGTVSDTTIQTHELHPASDTWLQPVPAPACEVIAAGRDRLWVAGGELLPGELAPSRLFDPGETPAFNAYLDIQVDRSNEPVTAIGFAGEIALIFRPNSTYILDSDGPDNNGTGFWSPVRLALADIGAISQESIARITQGIIFQSPAGFRVVGPGGGLQPIGVPVDVYAASFNVTGALVIEKDQEVRFYGDTATLVYNYLYDTWSYWTVGGVGVAKNNTGYALVARSDGNLWVEEEGVWTDGGNTYALRLRTPWLHAGNLGDFQRVRRIGGIGRYADLDLPDHNIRLDLYFDGREFWEDRNEWTLPDTSTNQDTWGANTWGAGVWGDTSATISNLEDLTWDWVRMPAIQKCSAISIAIEDYNTDGPGFELSALTLEVARKHGLLRNPVRTGTGTYR